MYDGVCMMGVCMMGVCVCRSFVAEMTVYVPKLHHSESITSFL